MSEQIREALNDGQPKAEAETALAGGITDLMIFAEDCLKILFGNADSGIPNLDPEGSAVATAAKQHVAASCVFQRV
jgi:hypothetical protein